MDYPKLLYKKGGPHQCKGGTFDYEPAENDDDAQALRDAGYFDSVTEAMAGKPVSKDDDAPTRAEMEQKAKELGITFHPNTGDKKLGEMIAAALKA